MEEDEILGSGDAYMLLIENIALHKRIKQVRVRLKRLRIENERLCVKVESLQNQITELKMQ